MRESKNYNKLLIILIIIISALLVFNHFIIVLKIKATHNLSKIQNSNGDLYPVADFTANIRYVIEGELIQFNFTGDDGDPPATYYWDFGDGLSSISKHPTHYYTDMGSYTVNLTVTDSDGDNNTMSKKDYIQVVPDLDPVADFTVNTTSVEVGKYVKFLFTGYNDNPPTTFLWNFGDGSTSTAMNPTHSYDEEGFASITLKVTDKQGDYDILTKEEYIHVYASNPSVASYNIFIILGTVIIFSLVIFRSKWKRIR